MFFKVTYHFVDKTDHLRINNLVVDAKDKDTAMQIARDKVAKLHSGWYKVTNAKPA